MSRSITTDLILHVPPLVIYSHGLVLTTIDYLTLGIHVHFIGLMNALLPNPNRLLPIIATLPPH